MADPRETFAATKTSLKRMGLLPDFSSCASAAGFGARSTKTDFLMCLNNAYRFSNTHIKLNRII